jgi:hypothetical protein
MIRFSRYGASDFWKIRGRWFSKLSTSVCVSVIPCVVNLKKCPSVLNPRTSCGEMAPQVRQTRQGTLDRGFKRPSSLSVC